MRDLVLKWLTHAQSMILKHVPDPVQDGFPVFGQGSYERRLAGAECGLYKPPAALTLANVGVWLSLVEHLVRDEGVAGSNPATPTNT